MIEQIPRQKFLASFKTLHDSIFSVRMVHQKPFECANWELALIPGNHHYPKDFVLAFRTAVQSCGDAIVLATDCEAAMAPLHQESVCVGLDDFSSFWQIDRVGTVLASGDNHLFGISGKWGMIRYYDNFSCIGGEPVFMKCLYDSLGGKNALKQHFLDFNAEGGWQVDEDWKKQVIESIGWN